MHEFGLVLIFLVVFIVTTMSIGEPSMIDAIIHRLMECP